jgi:multidrug resistance efflux pump
MARSQYNSIKQVYQEQAASVQELRDALADLQKQNAALNQASAEHSRDLLALAAARQALSQAVAHYNHPQELQDQVLAAQERYDQAVVGYHKVMADANAPVAGPTTVVTTGGVSAPDTTALDADIVQAQSDVAIAEEDVRRLNIVAPMDGTVVDWQATQGQNIQGGQALGSVVDLKHLKVYAEVRPQLAEYMLPGSTVKVVMPGPDQRKFEGRVVGAGLIDQTGQQKITINVTDPDEELVPGSTVTVQTENLK